MNISFAEKLRIVASRQNIQMGALAEASGQTRQNLCNKMTRGNFTEKDMEKIADALGCRLEIKLILPNGDEV